jgi:hypothetical protein
LYPLSLQPLGSNVIIGGVTDNTIDKLQVNGSTLITGAGGTGSNVLVVNGYSGQLFSVTDSLVGDIFAVSDISGIPILTVNSTETVTIDGTLYMNSILNTGLTASTNGIQTFLTNAGYGAFFDYYVTNGTGSRAGTIMANWNSTTVSYTDTCTADLGGATTGIEFTVDISASYVRLNVTITSGTWTVKSGTRII